MAGEHVSLLRGAGPAAAAAVTSSVMRRGRPPAAPPRGHGLHRDQQAAAQASTSAPQPRQQQAGLTDAGSGTEASDGDSSDWRSQLSGTDRDSVANYGGDLDSELSHSEDGDGSYTDDLSGGDGDDESRKPQPRKRTMGVLGVACLGFLIVVRGANKLPAKAAAARGCAVLCLLA